MAQPGALFATLLFLLARDPASNELLLHWFKGPCCQDDICRQASVLRSSLRNLPVEEYGTLFAFFTVTWFKCPLPHFFFIAPLPC